MSLSRKVLNNIEEKYKDKKVYIKNKADHPWHGETGVCEGAEKTLVGYGLKIKLDNGASCFIFDPKMLTVLD